MKRPPAREAKKAKKPKNKAQSQHTEDATRRLFKAPHADADPNATRP